MPGATTCRACGRTIPDNEPAALCDRQFFHHIDCLPEAVHAWHARDRHLVALKLASPLRAPADQADTGHLPLFVAALEPTLI